MDERAEYYCSAALRLERLQLQGLSFTRVKQLSTGHWSKESAFGKFRRSIF